MTLELPQIYLMLSLSLYTVEMVVVGRIRDAVRDGKALENDDFELSEVARLMDEMSTEHFLIYSILYLVLLWVCRYFTVVFPVLLVLQVLSFSMDLYLLKQLK